ncbi:H-2 class II histocompatibility antigen, E-S beta chain-like [Menidia menidia]
MSRGLDFFILFELFLVFLSEGTLYGHYDARCQSSSHDGQDAVLLEQFYINKKLEAQYNSTLGKIVGYTKKAKELADLLNKSPNYLHHQIWKANLCKKNTPLAYEGLLTPVEPYVWLRPAQAGSSKHPLILICSAYDFYPKMIRVSWLRDGEEVKTYVTSTEELPNGNWLYQMHSYLELTPKPGEKISCMVEHASLMDPKLYHWEPKLDFKMNEIAVGSAGLILGLLFSVGGFIYYKKKTIERVAVPTTEVFYPDATL